MYCYIHTGIFTRLYLQLSFEMHSCLDFVLTTFLAYYVLFKKGNYDEDYKGEILKWETKIK